MATSDEISDSIRPLLKLCREHIDRSIRMDAALLRSLERDPLLTERLRRLRTVPGVGPITALTWALEIGDTSRFRSIKQAVSYCGLCSAGEELGRQADAYADLDGSKPMSSGHDRCSQSVRDWGAFRVRATM